MVKPFSKKGRCVRCRVDTDFVLHKQVFSNGSENFVWVCSVCNQRNPSGDKQFFIPHQSVKGYLNEQQIDELPLLMPDLSSRCTRCGSRDAELHHWGPKELFADAELWPKDYLCTSCHDLWHKTMKGYLR